MEAAKTMRLSILLLIAFCAFPFAAHALNSCVVPNGQTYTVDELGTCRRVANSHASGLSILVPTKTVAEWSTGANAFINATPAGVTVSACPSGSPQTIFLTSPTGSNQTWSVPSNWDSATNQIEVIGGGAGGVTPSTTGGGGGGGGAYSKITNLTLTPSGSATFRVGSGGGSGVVGGDTWYNGTTLAG